MTTQSILTLGMVRTNLMVQKYFVPHTFHIVDEDFNIPTQEILGKDFLKANRCTINYDNMTASFCSFNTKLKIPISHGTENDNFLVPPRCEVFRIFKLME